MKKRIAARKDGRHEGEPGGRRSTGRHGSSRDTGRHR